MKLFTDIVSDDLTKALKETGFPISQADMGFTFPQVVDLNPTYAEVLDWVFDKGINIRIWNSINSLVHLYAITDTTEMAFKETFESIILLALDFIKTN